VVKTVVSYYPAHERDIQYTGHVNKWVAGGIDSLTITQNKLSQ